MISQNGIFGMISGVITTALLQPFQNIKMALMIPPKKLNLDNNFVRNIKSASIFIYNEDGYKGFYKGMIAAILKAALGCYSFFGTLKYLEKEDMHAGHNFVHSFVARIVSSIVTNPLNIIETRFQLADFHAYTSVHGAMVEIYQKEGLKAFFSGGLTSCIKEGFFAGLYYMLYNELKVLGLNRATAGLSAGMLATAVTHPFQLIRARLQTMGLHKQPTVEKAEKHIIWRQLVKMKESGDLMRGLAPRIIKKPVANTLTFLIFEAFDQTQGNSKKE